LLPEPGQIVHVRSRLWLVEETTAGPDARVRLACVEDDAQGEELEVLWDQEIDASLRPSSWSTALFRGFDDPRLFSAWLHTLRWSCVTSTDPDLLQAPWRAGIEVKAWQVEPLRKALLLPRVNLFIADDVGLGKTIEAGLIVRELLLRQRVSRVVICAPPSVVLQWRDEMQQRFGLGFAVIDREYVSTCRRERGFTTNPWDTHSRFILSHALLRDESWVAPLRDWLTDFAHGALLILDEAHHAAPSSGSLYPTESDLTQQLRDLAPRFEHRLFLSATPHNGHTASFSALLELLDPQRFCRGVRPSPALTEPVMVRRLKEDLRELEGGFPERKVVPVRIDGLPSDAPELSLPRLLARYAESFAGTGALVMTRLQKRLLSSIEAFATTLAAHRRGSASQRNHLPDAPSSDDERATWDEGLVEDEELTAVAEAATPHGGDLLEQMTHIAERSRHQPDARVHRLLEWIRRELMTDGAWGSRRVLIFTEYTATRRYLHDRLAEALGGDDRILALHGGMSETAREKVKRAFNADPSTSRVRILIATDAAREGVNLQNHCADLFHFDLPWNPSRIEQRNGRIDRKLQRAPVVRCHYFVLTQRDEDPVLEALYTKIEDIRRDLGVLPPILDTHVEDLLKNGIPQDQAPQLKRSMSRLTLPRGDIDEDLEHVRARRAALRAQIGHLEQQLDRSREWLALRDDAFRDAVSASLTLSGAPPLQKVGGAWSFPPLDRHAAGHGWSETLDTLRTPREPDQRLADWRRDAPLRPVVFADPGSLDGNVVHLHLEHRVAQRLLGRFLSQGFVHHDLSRAVVVLSDHPTPRVLVLGRLSLYGRRAARLHDSIITVSADWIEPSDRRAPLRASPATHDTLRLLEDALHLARVVPASLHERLLACAPRDIQDLEPQLRQRGEADATSAASALQRRAEAEAEAMRNILETQRERIRANLEKPPPQLDLFPPEEARQLASDRRHQERRLSAIEQELRTEPDRIRRSYDISARRVEPVGVVYLWPGLS
jgi:superfamily II DNA or RNA helicase